MNEHTKEPWEIYSPLPWRAVVTDVGWEVVDATGNPIGYVPTNLTEAVARHIVACVNARTTVDHLVELVEGCLSAWVSLGVHSAEGQCDPAAAAGTPKVCVHCELRNAIAKLKTEA